MIKRKNEEEVSRLQSDHLREKTRADKLQAEIYSLENSVAELKRNGQHSRDEVFELRREIELLRQTEMSLKSQILVKPAPKIERIVEPVEKIVYQPDPTIAAENQRLAENLQTCLNEEKRVKGLLIDYEKKFRNMESEIRELKSSMTLKVQRSDEFPQKVELITTNLNTLMEAQKKRFLFEVLSLNSKHEKEKKEWQQKVQKTTEKILVSQKLEVVDGTFAVFNDLRAQLIEWVFNVFKECADFAFTKKMNSFVVFKKKIDEMKKIQSGFDFVALFWFRLKNLVEEELPKLKIITEKTEVVGQVFGSEAGSTKGAVSVKQYISQGARPNTHNETCGREHDFNLSGSGPKGFEDWVLKNLIETVKKHKASAKTIDDFILLVFRLTAIKYRVEYPLVSEKGAVVSQDLLAVLETKICSAILNLFTKSTPTQTIIKRKEKSKSQKRRFNVNF